MRNDHGADFSTRAELDHTKCDDDGRRDSNDLQKYINKRQKRKEKKK